MISTTVEERLLVVGDEKPLLCSRVIDKNTKKSKTIFRFRRYCQLWRILRNVMIFVVTILERVVVSG